MLIGGIHKTAGYRCREEVPFSFSLSLCLTNERSSLPPWTLMVHADERLAVYIPEQQGLSYTASGELDSGRGSTRVQPIASRSPSDSAIIANTRSGAAVSNSLSDRRVHCQRTYLRKVIHPSRLLTTYRKGDPGPRALKEPEGVLPRARATGPVMDDLKVGVGEQRVRVALGVVRR